MSTKIETLIAVLLVAAAVFASGDARAACTNGDKAQVLWKGTWYPATVLKGKGSECYIHYDGYNNSWDEWVGPDRIKITSAGPVPAGGSLNISCSDSVKSLNKTATMEFSVACPVNCTHGSVWGTDTYTTDSALCVAAVHAGIIKEQGGAVKIRLAPGQPSYSGTFRNGVTTNKWGSYDQSFTVSK